MKKKVLISAVILALIAFGGVSVFAASEKAESVKEKISLKREVIKVKQCENVEEKVSRKSSKIEINSNKRLTSFKKTREKLQGFINRLDNKGYEVDILKADLVTFDAKVDKYKADFAVYLTLLKETKQFTCGKSETEFKAKLEAARAQRKIVQQDSVDLRTFYAKTFRQHILDLKSQTQVLDGDAEDKDTSENTTETTTGTNETTSTTTGGVNE